MQLFYMRQQLPLPVLGDHIDDDIFDLPHPLVKGSALLVDFTYL